MPSVEDFSSEGMLDDIIQASLQYEGPFRSAFLAYIEQARTDPSLLDLLQDIADGEIEQVNEKVEDKLRKLSISTDQLQEVLEEVMKAVGDATVNAIGVEMAFDMTMPDAILYAERLGARLITNIDDAVKDSIRGVLKQVLESDMTLPQMRRFVRNRVGLLPQHSQAVSRYYNQTVAGGVSPYRARNMAVDYANRLLDYRVDTIVRTEVAMAQSYGQLSVWKQMSNEGIIPNDAYRIWITAKDERVCEYCGPMHLQVAPIGGSWWTPNGLVEVPTEIHPNCRCASGVTFSRGRAREFLNKGPDTGYDWWLLEKHLGTQHDQKTHGRRKKEFAVEGVAFGYNAYDEMFDVHESQRKYNRAGDYAESLKDNVARTIGDVLDKEFDERDLRELSTLVGVPSFLKRWTDKDGESIPYSKGDEVAAGLVLGWAMSSTSPVSQLLQEQVSEMFGFADDQLQSSPTTNSARSQYLGSTYYNSRTKRIVRRVAELMYENTQNLLAEVEGDDLIVYRGINSDAVSSKVEDGQEWGSANVEQLPLASWSGSYGIASDFGRQKFVGNEAGVVMATVVPKSRIFSTAFTGVGCDRETEFVVIGSESDPVVIFADPLEKRSDRQLVRVIGNAKPILDELEIKKAAQANINIDADIRNADWLKRTFDIPSVTTTKEYREAFGLEDDEALAEHIAQWKDTPYWDGIPSKIKTGLLKARLSKHLGNEHDQKTHGRRKGAPQAEYKTGIGTVKDKSPVPTQLKGDITAVAGLLHAQEIFEVQIELDSGETVETKVEDAYTTAWDRSKIKVEGKVLVDGVEAGAFSREIRTEDGNVYNNSFNLLSDFQQKGIGTTLLRHWEDQYYQAGYSEMQVHASSGSGMNGAYTWLKYGYEPYQPASVALKYCDVLVSVATMQWDINPDVLGNLRKGIEATGIPSSWYETRLDTLEQVLRNEDNNAYYDARSELELGLERGAYTDGVNDLLSVAADHEDFKDFLKGDYGTLGWDGWKTTEPLFGSSYSKNFNPKALEVINRWMVSDPAGLENDAPEFWQEIRDAYASVSKHLGNEHDQKTHGRRKGTVSSGSKFTERRSRFAPLGYRVQYNDFRWGVGKIVDFSDVYAAAVDGDYVLPENYEEEDWDRYSYGAGFNMVEEMGWSKFYDFVGSEMYERLGEYVVDKYWVHFEPQSIMRTIGAAMMGIPRYASNGDEALQEKFGDDVMDGVYDGTKEIENEGAFQEPDYVTLTASLMASSAKAAPSEESWYRGQVFTDKHPIFSTQQGDTFVLPPSSFGGAEAVATRFIRGGVFEPTGQMMEVEESSVFNTNWRDVIIELQPGSVGVRSGSSTDLQDMGGNVFKFEQVTNGVFEVVSRDDEPHPFLPDESITRVVIRQTETYDPFEGGFVEVVE